MNPRVPGNVIGKQILCKCCLKQSMLENPRNTSFVKIFFVVDVGLSFFGINQNGCNNIDEISGNS